MRLTIKAILVGLGLFAHVPFAQGIYVIHTYGDPAIVQIAQDELNRGGGGTVSMYQDKLIIKASSADYARVSALVAQIDTAPTPLNISVAISSTIDERTHGSQVSVGISQRVWINGHYQNDTRHTTSNSIYTARTLSGSPVSISSSTLIGLTNWQTHRQGTRYWLNVGTTWVSLSEGFFATAKSAPNGQILLQLHSTSDSNTLNTTLTLPQGQWVKVGNIAKDSHNQSGFGQHTQREHLPIWVKVD